MRRRRHFSEDSGPSGHIVKNDYLKVITDAGFNYRILDEDIDISKTQYQGINLESLKVELFK